MLLRSTSLVLLALCAAGACPNTPAPGPCGASGSASAPMTGELVQVVNRVGENAPSATIVGVTIPDGGPLMLSPAPQGGYVFFAGAFVQNLDTCKVTISGELVDPTTGDALTNRDQRQGDFTLSSDGYTLPSDLYSDLPNIPACPGALGEGIIGVPAILKVTVTDETGKSGTFSQAVLPVCAQNDATCRCECGPSDGGC